MAAWLFLLLNIIGTLATLASLRNAGGEVAGPLAVVLDLIGRYVVPLTILSVLVTAAAIIRRRRKAGASDREALARLEAERPD